MQGTRGDQRSGDPGDEVLVTPTPIRDWFLRPPYPGTLLSTMLIGLLFSGSLLIGRSQRTPPEPPQVALAPVIVPAEPTTKPAEVEEAPVVTVRPIPDKAPQPTAAAPEVATPPLSAPRATAPMTTPAAPPAPFGVPGDLRATPDPAVAPTEIPLEPAPQEAPRVQVPPIELPRPEPARPEFVPEETPRPRPQVAPARPARPTGRLTVFFDADSTTFDRRDERLPLRVQVFVDGEKRLESDDPEKREFDLGDLPEGRHDVVVVPFVGRNQPEPRRMRVDIDAQTDNRFKAVLRREDGVSRVSKFRSRD